MKLRLLIVSLMVALLSVLVNSTVVFAWDEGVGLSNGWSGDWWADAQGFATTIDAYPGWNEYFISNDPLPTWWQEESSGGMDNLKADYTELSVMEGHSADLGNGLIGVGFGPDKGYAGPSSVRLGYASPDGYGYNIWWFIIECEVFKDTSYPSWKSSMTGTHMLLGFENTPLITTTDLREMAKRLTGSGGYSKEKVQDAFFHTYVKLDGIHDLNIARILAENSSVADNDYIDSFVYQTPVDSDKIVITCSKA